MKPELKEVFVIWGLVLTALTALGVWIIRFALKREKNDGTDQ